MYLDKYSRLYYIFPFLTRNTIIVITGFNYIFTTITKSSGSIGLIHPR